MTVEHEDTRFTVTSVLSPVTLCRFDETNDINSDMYAFYFACKFTRKSKLTDRSIILERRIAQDISNVQ